MKKIIVAGGRDFTNRSQLHDVCRVYFGIGDALVCGMAQGADAMAQDWAIVQRHDVIECPADWGKDDGDMLIAFWDGKSKGTKSMITEALKAGLEIHVFRYREEN